jgi:mannose-6-phosphate isomerase-like protein (cupin superfamily)
VEVRSALQVRQQGDIEGRQGVVPGQTYQTLIGVGDRPTDRVRIGRATYVAGTLEPLHWHPIEALYYVIAGDAIVRDVEGNEYPVGPGSFVYAPAGLAGAHEWEIGETLELLDIRATNETDRKFQFTVDKETLRSYIDVGELARREGIRFGSHY